MHLTTSKTKRFLGVLEWSLFGLCFYTATPYAKNPKLEAYPHLYSDLKHLYFTNISLYLTLITVVIGGICKYRRKFSHLYNILLPMSFTLEIVVTSVFWGLYLINPELIKNKLSLEPGFETPIIEEIGTHLFPPFLLFLNQLDMIVIYHKMQSIAIISFCITWYGIISIVAHQRGKYIYPFMNKITNDALRFGLFCLALPLVYFIHRLYIQLKIKKCNLKN